MISSSEVEGAYALNRKTRKEVFPKIFYHNEIPNIKLFLKLFGLTPYGKKGKSRNGCQFSPFLLSWVLFLNLCTLVSLTTNILYGKHIYEKSVSIGAFASSVMIVFSACVIFIPHVWHYKDSKTLMVLLIEVEKLQKKNLTSSIRTYFDVYYLQLAVFIVCDVSLLVELCFTDPASFWNTSLMSSFLKQFSCIYTMASVVMSFVCYRAILDVLINIMKKYIEDIKTNTLVNPFKINRKIDQILRLSKDAVSVFGFWIVSMFLIYLMIAIVLIFDLLRKRDLHGVNHILAIAVAIWNIFMYCDIAQQFTNKAEKMEITLRKAAFSCSKPTIQLKLLALADQVETEKYLKASNYVAIGRGTFTSMMEVMTTYVVIMYQLGDVSQYNNG